MSDMALSVTAAMRSEPRLCDLRSVVVVRGGDVELYLCGGKAGGVRLLDGTYVEAATTAATEEDRRRSVRTAISGGSEASAAGASFSPAASAVRT